MKEVLLSSRYKDYKPGRILTLEDDEASQVVANGLGEVMDSPIPSDKDDSAQPTLDAFAQLAAGVQKEWLVKLQIDGDSSNEDKRVALYAAYLQST
ncbi:hypothetical protein [Cohnella yongneupensis]|uniref:Uncharacterized protein n=1 Tax=Cohnella yongneupensis TaxID=425006 RepID=A0ABW0QVC4_9BACL